LSLSNFREDFEDYVAALKSFQVVELSEVILDFECNLKSFLKFDQVEEKD
jgi:hypothetical protein